jgi:hypothetical protein
MSYSYLARWMMLSENEYYENELATYWEEAEDAEARKECSSAIALRPHRPQVKSSLYRRLKSSFESVLSGGVISSRPMHVGGKRLAG